MDICKIICLVKSNYLRNNKEDVLHHVENVAEIAVELAKVYNLDTEKIKLAAYLHDISGIMTPQEMYDAAIMHSLKIDAAEEKYHSLLHQRISRIIAWEEYGIVDSDILNAIECHTTLKKNASLYDKVIFIADKLSWDKTLASELNHLLKNENEESLNEACYLYLKYQFDNDLLVMPHQWILEAYDDLRKD